MFKATVIGNLGAPAEQHSENGSEFITFKVAHNERFRDSQGNQQERSVWISCIMNGRADGLVPYLVKGATVAVFGDLRLKTYHSAKMHMLVAGADLFVRSVELVGARPDNIPSRLYDTDGVQHNVTKFFYCDTAKGKQLLTQAGDMYNVDANGWVSPMVDSQQANVESVVNSEPSEQQADVFEGADNTVEPAKSSRKRR